MKRFVCAALFVTMLTLPALAAEYELTLANHLPDETVESQSYYWFAKQVEEKSNGRLKIHVSTAGALGGQREIVEAVNTGALDMGMGENAMYGNYAPIFGVMTLPFIHSSSEKLFEALDGEIGKKLSESLEQRTNMKILCYTDGIRARDVYCVRPLATLADLNGLKIRTPESVVYVSTFKAFGANPTPISAPEMYTALQQGVVEAIENHTEIAVTYGIYELTKHCLETHHILNENSIVINQDVYADLPEDLQKILDETARELSDYNRQLAREASDGYKRKMIESGVVFVPVDIAQAKDQVIAAGVYKNFVGDDPEMNEILDMLLELQEK